MKTQCYALVHKHNGNLITINSQLAIFWDKKVAKIKAELFPLSEIVTIKISEIEKLIKPKEEER